MFRGWDGLADERLFSDLDGESVSRRARVLAGKFFPPRARLAMRYPVPVDSPAIYLCYVRNAWRLAGRRLPEVAQGRGKVARDAGALAELDRWLVKE